MPREMDSPKTIIGEPGGELQQGPKKLQLIAACTPYLCRKPLVVKPRVSPAQALVHCGSVNSFTSPSVRSTLRMLTTWLRGIVASGELVPAARSIPLKIGIQGVTTMVARAAAAHNKRAAQ